MLVLIEISEEERDVGTLPDIENSLKEFEDHMKQMKSVFSLLH